MNGASPRLGDTPAHALNNLLCKIMATAELALDGAEEPAIKEDLCAIMGFAEAAAALVETFADIEP